MNRGLIALNAIYWTPFALKALSRAARRHKTGDSPVSTEARSSDTQSAPLIALHACGFTMLAVAWFTPGIASPWERFAGAAVILLATLLASWTLAVFRSWKLSANLDTNHDLCTKGPFRFVRHPIYLSFDLLALGTLVWVGGPIALAAVLVIAYAGDRRARLEEATLLRAYGERYRTVMAQAKRFLPGLY